ncbi:MAG: hypothetical protein K0Q68_2965 [Moraxellaceae bacterium]|jgi:uncharacterized membrane protein|nr:hypothetical protein [Moraxellaceae bacterium]
MTALIFLGALMAILGIVLALEANGDHALRLQRPAGLLTWLTRGNWPAKTGGALIVVGVGALLRFALINIEVDPPLKLAGGIVIALALGMVSMLVPAGVARRPVSLALGGAGFGVAYMTAYSAFAFFGYLSRPEGLVLLGLTATAAGVYAVTRSALSLALLAMFGAFLAPAFALAKPEPGPEVVYGYYVGASLLTLAMVAIRGWRPLIHLSFLFTLAGGVFFAWTAKYYAAANAPVMMPLLLALAAIHVAMPIVERHAARGVWLQRLDVVYMLALPAVSALLAVFICPDVQARSLELLALGAIWALAAVALRAVRRDGVAAHAIIAALLLLLGVAARFRDLPWELILLALAVAGLAVAARLRRPVDSLHGMLAGLVLLFGTLHVLYSLVAPAPDTAFANAVFIERLIGAALIITAGVICRRIDQALDTLLLAVGILWAVIALGSELVRFNLATTALVLHWMLLLLALGMWVPGRKVLLADNNVSSLVIAILTTALWASLGNLDVRVIAITLFATPLVLISIAVRPARLALDTRDQRFGAALMAPAAAAIWGFEVAGRSGIPHWQFGFVLAAVFALATLLAGSMVDRRRGAWLDSATDVFGVAFAAQLGLATVFNIARNPWAVMLEIFCLALLALVVLIRRSRQRPVDLSLVACLMGLALIFQANIMRWLGPAGDMNFMDLFRLEWPSVVSLLWAVIGSALTLSSQRLASRSLWVAGATLLVAAAIKVLLLDFGSLGQLANILAVIAAGIVFLLVGWLAPMPPAAPDSEAAPALAGPADEGEHRKNSWTLAVIAILLVMAFNYRQTGQVLVRESLHSAQRASIDARPTPGIVADGPENPQQEAAPGEAPAEEGADMAATDMPADAAATPAAGVDATQGEERVGRELEPVPKTEAEAPWVLSVDANGVRTYSQATPSMTASPEAQQPAPGQEGIEQLLRAGSLRRANAADVEAWMAATSSKNQALRSAGTSRRDQPLFRTYVVTRQISLPEGLYGANAATFIIPRGVPYPHGNPGHSQMLAMP